MFARFSQAGNYRNVWIAGVLLAVVLGMTGCAATPDSSVDPIFSAVPGQRYGCTTAPADQRSAIVKGTTSTLGQAAIGGAAGGLLGNQFGSHTGRDLATGAGVLAGAAAGAWNAQRMRRNRVSDCYRRQSGGTADANGNALNNYRYQGG